MKIARIAVLGVALAAGGGAALMLRSGPAPAPAAAPAPALPTVEVLVSAGDLPMGQGLKATDLRWQSWPADASGSSLIRKSDTPNGIEELVGSIVRNPFINGEPIRREKLIKGDGGFMSAILPSGMRAVAISIDTRGATSAGGFILPNDRVDVIRTSQVASEGGPSQAMSEIILSNIRVLAIGQSVQERNGEKVVTGETATLELSPAQSEMVVLAQKIGQLSLALRSLADVNETGTPVREERSRALQIIRFGVQQQAPVK
jgi:pilus assembly protein CpaB